MSGYLASKKVVVSRAGGLGVAVLAAVALVLLAASPARAVTFGVDRTDDPDPTTTGACTDVPDDCSLRGALISANASHGEAVISLRAGEYHLSVSGGSEDQCATGDLDVTDEVTIRGAGASRTVVSAGAEEGSATPDLGDRVFHVLSGSEAAIEDLALSGGSVNAFFGTGGGLRNNGTVTLVSSAVRENSATDGFGGGICNEGTLNLTDATVNGNTSFGGGVIFDAGSSSSLTDTTVSGNTADKEGGGIYSETSLPDPGTTIKNSTISGNSAGDVGGIYNDNGLTNIMSTTITNNTAPLDHGAGVASYGDNATRTTLPVRWWSPPLSPRIPQQTWTSSRTLLTRSSPRATTS